jgi:hypothetical protein
MIPARLPIAPVLTMEPSAWDVMQRFSSHTYTITMQNMREVESNKRMTGILDRLLRLTENTAATNLTHGNFGTSVIP